jgi:hypothetical protein
MDGIFHSKQSDEGSVFTTWGDPISDDRSDVGFVIGEYLIYISADEGFSRDSSACRRHDRHISIEGKVEDLIIAKLCKYFNHIRTNPIVFTISDISILHDIFIGRIIGVFYDESIGIHEGFLRE